MWKRHRVPTLFFMTGVAILAASGLAAYRLTGGGIDAALHDTYYVVAHVRWAAVVGGIYAVIILTYSFFHRIIGVHYRRWMAQAHFVALSVGMALLLIPQLYHASQAGMPLRYEDTEAMLFCVQFGRMGALFLLLSFALFGICIADGVIRRVRHGRDPYRYGEQIDETFK